MMRFVWAGLLLLTATACNRQATPASGTPDCLSATIQAFQAADGGCADRFVTEHTFQGQTVYVLNHGTCGADMTDEVVDANCKHLGNLGGIMGNLKINGEDFRIARQVRVVWKAP
jgi:hypothetical protein